MMATENTDWMEEEDIPKHWFLPALDLTQLTCYAGQPIEIPQFDAT